MLMDEDGNSDDEEQEKPACLDAHKFHEVFQATEHLKT